MSDLLSQDLQFTAELSITAATATRPATFKAVAYSGGILYVAGGPAVVDLAGAEFASKQTPCLFDHKGDQVVGFVTRQTITANAIVVEGKFNGAAAAQRVLGPARHGQSWQLSIGARIVASEDVYQGQSAQINGRLIPGPFLHVLESVIREISFVAVGGDEETQVSIAASAEGIEMTTKQTTDLDQELELRRRKTAEEDRRVTSIQATAQKYDGFTLDGLTDPETSAPIEGVNSVADLRAHAIGEGWTPQRAELALLRASRNTPSQNGPFTHSRGGGGASRRTVLECAAALHGGLPDPEKEYGEHVVEAARSLRATSLVDIAKIAAGDNPNTHIRHGGHGGVIEAALSTTDFSNILLDVANKSSAAAYRSAPSVAMSVCKIESANDFRVHHGVRASGDGTFNLIGREGQVEHGSWQDQDYTFQVATYAKLVGITRQDLIDDNASALSEIPALLAREAANRLEEVFTIVVLTSVGTSFLDGTNGNTSTGALGIASLADANTKMREVKGLDGKPIMADPNALVVPPALEYKARDLFVAGNIEHASATAVPDNNPAKGLYRPNVSPWFAASMSYPGSLSGSDDAWYLMAAKSPSVAPYSLAFLRGQSTPVIESMPQQSDRLGIEWRIYHDFGVAQRDWRGVVRSTGAA